MKKQMQWFALVKKSGIKWIKHIGGTPQPRQNSMSLDLVEYKSGFKNMEKIHRKTHLYDGPMRWVPVPAAGKRQGLWTKKIDQKSSGSQRASGSWWCTPFGPLAVAAKPLAARPTVTWAWPCWGRAAHALGAPWRLRVFSPNSFRILAKKQTFPGLSPGAFLFS